MTMDDAPGRVFMPSIEDLRGAGVRMWGRSTWIERLIL